MTDDEAQTHAFLQSLAQALEQQHGPCKVERDVLLRWLDQTLRAGLATGADEEVVVASVFKAYPVLQLEFSHAQSDD
jgi:hypothetical protein